MIHAKKPKALRYKSLWENRSDIKLASGQYEAYYKKSLDAFCLNVDMAESLDKYIELFCEGMTRLLDIGVPKVFFMKHSLVITKILRFGEDILEYSQRKSDLFYIGLFVDQKISTQWYNCSFYHFVNKMLRVIYTLGKELPDILKKRIEELIKNNNYPLYALYFIKDATPSFKSSA